MPNFCSGIMRRMPRRRPSRSCFAPWTWHDNNQPCHGSCGRRRAWGWLWRRSGRATQARDLLAATCDRFTEGFDTADVAGARRLID